MNINFQQGVVFAIEKPYLWSSFALVAKVRKMITEKTGEKIKIGHAGTLDPLAKGVMILCTGRATRLVDELQAGVKEYVTTLALGATTPSFDMEHPIDKTYPTEHITAELIEDTLQQFQGQILQVPPAYSAVKVQGKRAYDLARKGEEVTLTPKALYIEEIEIIKFNSKEMLLTLRVLCSKGTYIRALARDIGEALQSGAYLTNLERTRVGSFSAKECYSLETFEKWLNECVISSELLPNVSKQQQKRLMVVSVANQAELVSVNNWNINF